MDSLNSRESAAVAQTLLDSAPMGAICLDVEGRVRVWNVAAERILGWERHEVLGAFLPMELHLPEDDTSESEHRLQTKDKAQVEVRAQTVPWQSPSGEHGKLILLTDLTAIRTMEGKL